MLIQQFYDKGLAHASYAIISEREMMVIDPARNPEPYFEFAKRHHAKITGVIETHPHADFVSSHLEIHQKTGATIYASKLLGAEYPHTPFDEGNIISLGKIKLKAINTPGHSPDSICILVLDEKGLEQAVFTGDTLFVGDVGRPDLRENVGNLTAQKEELAKAMYQSTRQKLMTLPSVVVVYPAHGPGSLCGKNMSPELDSTIGKELRENYALQPMTEPEFVKILTNDQPFIPKYFGYNVELNKKGAQALDQSIQAIPRISADEKLEEGILIIDTRPQFQFKAAHLPKAINLQDGTKFETWLGSIINPAEAFYLIAENESALEQMIQKTAKIGYESQIKGALTVPKNLSESTPHFNLDDFNRHPENFTIVDIRNRGEVNAGKMFENAISIPLPELRERVQEIPQDKPIVVHCAGGYRSAAGSSIIAGQIKNTPVLDMSEAVNQFSNNNH
ncbi:MAG TPA: MBL fold metallo-hydrolase [Daejeonella sp.]|nr:MBL fold metallo-hydrolase [Daejeonella sp.]